MIFEPAEYKDLPTKDLLSYIFDDPLYDQDRPVSVSASALEPPVDTADRLRDLGFHRCAQPKPHDFLQPGSQADQTAYCGSARLWLSKRRLFIDPFFQ